MNHCPEHGTPGADWGRCPDDCPHFDDEMQRRLHDVTINGNYFRMLPRRSDGEYLLQEYRNHKPHGEPRLF